MDAAADRGSALTANARAVIINALSQHHPAERGPNVARLVELVERALNAVDLAAEQARGAADEAGFGADVGLSPEHEQHAAVLRQRVASLIAAAKAVDEYLPRSGDAEAPDAAIGDRLSLDSLDYFAWALMDLFGGDADHGRATAARVWAAVAELSAIKPAAPARAKRGPKQEWEPLRQVVRAVVVYRREAGLNVQYDWPTTHGPGGGRRGGHHVPVSLADAEPPTYTAALVVAVAQAFNIEVVPERIRSLLQEYRREQRARGTGPLISDLDWFF